MKILRGLLNRRYEILSPLWKVELFLRGVKFHASLRLYGRPIITKSPDSEIILNENTQIYSHARSNSLGLSSPSVIRTLNPGAKIEIGSGTGMSGAILCAAKSIIVGKNTLIGAGA